ncbi:MAG: hypothetical protein R2878_10410 [Thermoleophilia bacterium]
MQHGPVELGHEVTQWPARDVGAERIGDGPGGFDDPGEVEHRGVGGPHLNKCAIARVACAGRGCRPQPEGEIERGDAVTEGVFEHAPANHGGGTQERMMFAHQSPFVQRGRSVGHGPGGDRVPVDDLGVPVGDPGLDVLFQGCELTGQAVGKRPVARMVDDDELAGGEVEQRRDRQRVVGKRHLIGRGSV